jgi:hypothetical protein
MSSDAPLWRLRGQAPDRWRAVRDPGLFAHGANRGTGSSRWRLPDQETSSFRESPAMPPVMEVENFSELNEKVVKVIDKKKKSELLAFFLFDDSSGQKAVSVFAKEWIHWLDTLSDAAHTFFFVFVATDRSHKSVKNPSIEVASLFGIRPNELPGIILFDMQPNMQSVNKGIYFPLKPSLFEKDILFIEKIFADFFSIIMDCQLNEDPNSHILSNVEIKIKKLKNKQKLRPFVSYIKANVKALVNLPATLGEALSNALAKRIGKAVEGSR